MVILYTEPLPLLSILLSSVFVVLIMFFVKIYFSDRLFEKTLNKYPLILFIGPPKSGKKVIIENLSGRKTKIKVYPFVGKFRICDTPIKDKNIRCMTFNYVSKSCRVVKENIKIRKRKPKSIIFAVRIFSDSRKTESQLKTIEEIKEIFPGVPVVPVSRKKSAIARRIFGRNLVELEGKGFSILKKIISS